MNKILIGLFLVKAKNKLICGVIDISGIIHNALYIESSNMFKKVINGESYILSHMCLGGLSM